MSRLPDSQQAMVDLFERHVQAELDGDLETTMATMTESPHLNHVPTMMGGVGREGVRAFYRDHLVGRFFRQPAAASPRSALHGVASLSENPFQPDPGHEDCLTPPGSGFGAGVPASSRLQGCKRD
jgi:hypothetical protein